jgi:hypothetical protein
MSDPAPDQSEPADDQPDTGPLSPWLRATLADLEGLDFEASIKDSKSADAHELSELYRALFQRPDGEEAPDTAEIRTAMLLSAVTGMHFKPSEPNEPFGPMMVLADGRRTPVPSDFKPGHIDLLSELAIRATHPVLRTRLADVCWLLDRKRAHLGVTALVGYGEIVLKADKGELLFRFEKEGGALQHSARDLLRRALQLARMLGWDKPEAGPVRNLVATLRKRAAETKALVPLWWFSDLDLDYRVSDPLEVAAGIDEVLANLPAGAQSHIVIELWRQAARAYHLAKRDEDKFRCMAAAAERLVADAEAMEKRPNSAMVAAHWLSQAIAQLHGIPDKKERRTALRHKLIDIQARVSEEMSSFSHPLDVRELVEAVEKGMAKASLIDKLFIFASLASSPDPEELASEAAKAIGQSPLASLFPTSHMDHEGKVVHRSEGGGRPGEANDSAVTNQIAQAESIRRQIAIAGRIDPARQMIVKEHFLSDDLLRSLLQYSAFVPEDLVATFARGFLRFFQGDFVSATYILTPLLENSLRHVLKMNGHDVSIFDDATQTQEDRTISSLFEQMREELDGAFTKGITTDIDNVFLKKPGPYLRHSVAHGLLHDGTPYGPDAAYACWLIFRLCLLPLFPYRHDFQIPGE